MKTESEIRECISNLRLFSAQELVMVSGDGQNWRAQSTDHEREIRALEWVLGEYPPPPRERPQAPAPDPGIAQPMGPGGFAVRAFGGRAKPKE